MNPLNQFDQKPSLSQKVMTGFVSAIARLIIKFNINLNGFLEMIKVEVVRKIYDDKQKIYETAFLTGLDHRVVSKIVNREYSNHNSKGSMMEMLILQEIFKSAKLYKDQMIPKKGDFNSLTSILKKHGFSYVRLRTVIDVLLARGVIEEHENHIKYIGTNYTNKQSDEEFFSMISRNFNRYSSTASLNRDNRAAGVEGLYDFSIFSSQIHPDKHGEVDKQLLLMSRSFHQKVIDYLEQQETHPVGTFEEIGVSVFQYNLHRGKQNE